MCLLMVLMAGMFFSTVKSVEASNVNEIVKSGITEKTDYFHNMNDFEKVLPLPNGGFLHGEGTLYDVSDLSNALTVYNSETDSKSITVGRAKEILKAQEKESEVESLFMSKNLRGSTPPSKLINLSYGGSYTSNYFSGSGWRFAGYLFAVVNSAGPNLRWESHGDQGCIGTKQQAINTLDSRFAEGTLINNGAYLYLNGLTPKTYFVHSPISGTYYYVGNVD